MANQLSYSVALNMLTENFKKGSQEIKNGFNDIKSTAIEMAGVLGAGLGLSELASKMLDVAKESESVQRALKTASGGAAEYGENQKYLIETADKLGLKLNDITGQYAKFSAAAKTSLIPIKDQQAAFTGLNKAMIAGGVQGDKKTAVFDSLDKMMSKNVITTKMLTGGLGSEMPEALTLMAQSLGVSTDQLREMAKQHTLLASDVIPKFAKVLNDTFKDVDSDTIEGALNRVGNTFEELTAKLGTGNIYKSLVNGFEDAFKWVIDNFKTVGDVIVNVVSTVIIAKAFGAIKAGYIEIQTAAETSFINQAIQAEKAAVIEELAGTNLTKKSQKRYLDESLAAKKSYAEQEFATQKFALTSQLAFTTLKTSIVSALSAFAPMLIIAGLINIIQKTTEYINKQKELKSVWSDYNNSVKNAGENDSQVKNLQRLKQIADSTNETYENRKNALNSLNTILGTNYTIDEKTLKINGDINSKYKERLGFLEQQARYQKLVDIKLPTEDKQTASANTLNTLKSEQKDLQNKYKNRKTGDTGGDYGATNANSNVDSEGAWKAALQEKQNEINQEQKHYNDLTGVLTDITKKQSAIESKTPKATGNIDLNGDGSTGDGELTEAQKHQNDIEKAQDTYIKKTIELNNLLNNKVISQKKFNDDFDKHVEDGRNTLGSLLTPSEAKDNKIFGQIQSYKPKITSDDKLDDVNSEYIKQIKLLTFKHEILNTSADDFKKAQEQLIDSTINQILTNGEITESGKNLIRLLNSQKSNLENKTFTIPTATAIDHTFDYKKDDVEKQNDVIDQNKNYQKELVDNIGDKDIIKEITDAKGNLTDLKAKFQGSANELIDLLDDAMKKAPDLQKALKILEVKKDVKDLQTQLSTGTYSSIKEMANSAKNLYSSFKSIKDTFSNVNATGFEKILSVWDAMTNTIDSIMSIVKMIQSLETITKSLGAAKTVLTTIDTTTTATQITNIGALAAAKVAAAAIEVPAAVAITTASSAEMAAESAASYAAIPFVGEGLALAQIGVLNAAIMASGIPKFADGGVVGGSSYTGDKIIAGLNSGEVVLNQNQQNKLLNNQNSGGGQVTFVLKGRDLVGTINNYNNIKAKV